MKLVDILARELKQWPEGVERASQDPDKEIRFKPGIRFDFYSTRLASDAGTDFGDGAEVTRAQWQAAVDALKTERECITNIDWSKAPEDATHYFADCHGRIGSWWKVSDSMSGPPAFVRGPGGEWIAIANVPGYIEPIPGQAAVDALKAGEHSVQSIDWSKAPEGTTGAMVAQWDYPGRGIGYVEFLPSQGERDHYSELPDAWEYVPAPDQWNGEGLPPAGILVENNLHGPVMVLAHGIFRGGNVVICQGDDTIITCTPDTLSPIRTSEQIAAEERDKEIKDLYYTINWGEKPETWSHLSNQRKADYAKAIDAGFRKQVKS